MTTVKQIVPFDLAKMGTTPGWCEKNVREGYGLPAKLPNAKADMEYNKDNGLLHPMGTLPKKGAVPVFVDTLSPDEHIEVAIDGVFYSDGKKVTNPQNQKFFGWGESCATFRVVEVVPDPTPTPTPDPSTGIKVGDKVTLKNWVDYNGTPLKKTRDYYFVSQINGDRAVLNADSVSGPVYCAAFLTNLKKVSGVPAPVPAPKPTPIAIGDKVTLTAYVDYNGTPLVKTRDFYYVYQLNGDRAVLTADRVGGTVYAAVNIKNLKKV